MSDKTETPKLMMMQAAIMAGKQSKHHIKTCFVANRLFIRKKPDKRNIKPARKNKKYFAKMEFKRQQGKDKSTANKREEISPVTELKSDNNEAKLRREREKLVKHFNNIINTSQETHPSSAVAISTSYCVSNLYSDSEWSDSYDLIYDHDLAFCRRKTTKFCRKRRGQFHRKPEKRKLKESDCVSRRFSGNSYHKKASRNNFYNKRKKEQVLTRNADSKEKLGILEVLQTEEIFDLENEYLYNNNNNNNNGEVEDFSLDNRFALCGENAPDDLPEDILDFLLDLQDREITPEDYDLLLRLDASVPTKTVSEERIVSLKQENVLEEHVAENCGICMENYQVGETRKMLPCEHVFHANCIDTWLRHNSTKCPLDNSEI